MPSGNNKYPLRRKGALYDSEGNVKRAMLTPSSKKMVNSRVNELRQQSPFGIANSAVITKINGKPSAAYMHFANGTNNKGYFVEQRVKFENKPMQWRNTTIPSVSGGTRRKRNRRNRKSRKN
jgi:hypothetical protein